MSQRRPLVPVDPDEWQEDYVPRLSRRQQLTDGALVLGGVLVLAVVVIIGSAFLFRWLDEMEAGSGWIEIGRVQVGQCFDRDPTAPDDGIMPSVRIADCMAEHDGELIGRFEWDGPEDDNILDYPGLDTLFDYAGPRCDALAREYIGARYEDAFAEFVMSPLVPLRSAWMQEASGGRVFQCIVEGAGREKLAGSARGSRP